MRIERRHDVAATAPGTTNRCPRLTIHLSRSIAARASRASRPCLAEVYRQQDDGQRGWGNADSEEEARGEGVRGHRVHGRRSVTARERRA